MDCKIGVMSFDDLRGFLEAEFTDEDRERKLLSKFSTFVQKKDLSSYISSFRSLRMELGNLITDESALW